MSLRSAMETTFNYSKLSRSLVTMTHHLVNSAEFSHFRMILRRCLSSLKSPFGRYDKLTYQPYFTRKPTYSVPLPIPLPEYVGRSLPHILTEIRPKTVEEIAGIRVSCQLAKHILQYAGSLVQVGRTTREIDDLGIFST